MDKPKVTPKDFFVWVGAMIALYVSVFSLLTLFFEYINYALPDTLQSYVDPYSGSIRFAIASLVVLFPVFLLLMRVIRNDIIAHPEKQELWIRRWVLYLTLFIAGATIVVDLIALINTYLGGDLTNRFALKVLIVFLVTGAGFLHFLADLKGYWKQYPERARMIGWGAAIVIVATILAGFFIIGSPHAMRLYKFDERKVADLSSIQWQIVSYWQQKQTLPAVLSDLTDSISGFTVPMDPQSGSTYIYQKTGGTSFKLCAMFNEVSRDSSMRYPTAPEGGYVSENWQHGAGEQCFMRTIDPERYPPVKKV